MMRRRLSRRRICPIEGCRKTVFQIEKHLEAAHKIDKDNVKIMLRRMRFENFTLVFW